MHPSSTGQGLGYGGWDPSSAEAHSHQTSRSSLSLSWSLALGCLGAASAAGAALTYYALRHRLKMRDSPDAPEDIRQEWERIMQEARERKKQRMQKQTQGDSVSDASPSVVDAMLDSAPFIIRAPTPADALAIADQTHDSFNLFNASVGLPLEFPSRGCTRGLMSWCVDHTQGLIAVSKEDGRILGSVFNDECDLDGIDEEKNGKEETMAGGVSLSSAVPCAVRCGPWSVAHESRNGGVGRALLQQLISQSIRHGARSLRLIQISANTGSLSLYSSLGFESREPVAMWIGRMRPECIAAAVKQHACRYQVREMTMKDVKACDAMHIDALGITRAPSMRRAIADTSSRVQRWVIEEKNRIVGFTTGLDEVGITIATSESALQFLLATAMQRYDPARHEEATDDEETRRVDMEKLKQLAPPNGYTYQPGAAPSPTSTSSSSSPLPLVPLPPPPSPVLHTCLRLYPNVTRWLLSCGLRVVRADNLMALGEWTPIRHDKYIYMPSIMS